MKVFDYIKYQIGKKKYPKMYEKYILRDDKPIVLDTIKTLELVRDKKLSLARFGDGEFHLIWGIDLPFQKYNDEIKKDLSEILIKDEEKIIIGIPDVFDGVGEYREKSATFWKEFIGQHYFEIINLIKVGTVYGNANCTRFFSGYEKADYDEIIRLYRKIFFDRDIVCIEGQKTRMGVGNDLFDGAKSFRRILVPAEDAYSIKNDILKWIDENHGVFNDDTLFILAVGPTATVLAYEICKMGYQALDLGHLDIQYEYYLAGSTEKVKVAGKYVNETKGGNIVSDDIVDEKYLSQIIKDFN